MQKRLPAILTVLLIGAAVFFLAQRQRKSVEQPSANESAPVETVVWRMLDAARAGDADAYLDCFTGELKQRLAKTRAEMGAAQFTEYLKKLDGEMTGVALSDLTQRNADEASLRVEFVYRGKNEAQPHHFQRLNGAWKIARIDSAERVNAPVPYGQAVSEGSSDGKAERQNQ